MTQRLKGFVVTLEKDLREDDAEVILNALRMIRHVESVEPVESNFDDQMNRSRIRSEFRDKLWAVLYPEYAKEKQ
jgi:hypothetical protein